MRVRFRGRFLDKLGMTAGLSVFSGSMFNLLGKKEVIGTTLWLAPVGLSIMGYLQWTPYRTIVAVVVFIMIVSVLVSIGGIVRFVVNYLAGPRVPLG